MSAKVRIAVALAMACGLALGLAGCGTGPGLTGNSTGGIIPWSPENQAIWHDWAMQHCWRYGKVAKLEAIHRGYGEYISFTCEFPRGGPRYVFH